MIDSGMDEKTLRGKQVELQKLTARIMSEIAFMEEEHRIFKRPFIVEGMDYLEELRRDYNEL